MANLSKDKDAKLWVYGRFVYDCQVADSIENCNPSAPGCTSPVLFIYLEKKGDYIVNVDKKEWSKPLVEKLPLNQTEYDDDGNWWDHRRRRHHHHHHHHHHHNCS